MSRSTAYIMEMPKAPQPPRATAALDVPEIIVNGLRWQIGDHHLNDQTPAHQKGLRGRRWTIRFHNRRLVRTDDLILDPDFKTSPERDTAIILEGWWGVTETTPICAWREAGDFKVYAPVPL